jgi:hypothetical protein
VVAIRRNGWSAVASEAAEFWAACAAPEFDKSLLLPETRLLRDKNTASNGCPNVPASLCGRQHQILIIFGSHSHERSGARSATSLLSPYAGLTTAKCIGSDEVGWWKKAGIDPLGFAKSFGYHSPQQSIAETMLCDTRLQNECMCSPTRYLFAEHFLFENLECF